MSADEPNHIAWAERFTGVALGAKQTAADPPSGYGSAKPGKSLDEAMGVWTSRRADTIASLKRLEDAFGKSPHPERQKAIILVKAIMANLTASPQTAQQVAELRRYLEADAIIAEAEMPNGYGFEVRIRAPLVAALDLLAGSLAA